MSSQSFAAKLALTLKALSVSPNHLAAEMQVNRSVVGRWVSGVVAPSTSNLARLTALVATRVEGFNMLDWDRDLDGLARRLGAVPAAPVNGPDAPLGLPAATLDQMRAAAVLRASAYEGVYRSTRMHARNPQFAIHDHALVRQDPVAGLMRVMMATADIWCDGWLLPLHNQVFMIGAERATGAPVFGIFHGISGRRANRLDGLNLTSIHDNLRTPTASVMLLERVADLPDDPAGDVPLLQSLDSPMPIEPFESLPKAVRDHLCRDIGPAAAAQGGEWLLQLPITRSLSDG